MQEILGNVLEIKQQWNPRILIFSFEFRNCKIYKDCNVHATQKIQERLLIYVNYHPTSQVHYAQSAPLLLPHSNGMRIS